MKMTLPKMFALAGALGISVSSQAQTNPPSVAASPAAIGPRIEFAELNYEFGKVDSGEVVKHDFVFTNTGDQTLEIKDVRPGCGCTTAGNWDKQVEPGKTGKIPIQFNSGGYSGVVHKPVTVLCNDPTKQSLSLGLQGTIWRAFEIIPTYAVFNLMPEVQTNQTQTVRIISNNDQPVTVSDPACNNPAFKTELKTLREGKEFELRVTIDSSQIPGTTSAPITVKTSSDKMPVISLTAFAMMQPLLAVNPPQINLPAGPLPKAMQSIVTVQNNGTNSVVLTEPHVSKDGLDVKLEERLPGRQFNLVVGFPAGFQSQPGENILVTVKSSNPKYPEVTIPVLQPMPAPVPAAPPAVPLSATTATPQK